MFLCNGGLPNRSPLALCPCLLVFVLFTAVGELFLLSPAAQQQAKPTSYGEALCGLCCPRQSHVPLPTAAHKPNWPHSPWGACLLCATLCGQLAFFGNYQRYGQICPYLSTHHCVLFALFKGRKNNFPPLFHSEIFFHSAAQPLKRVECQNAQA